MQSGTKTPAASSSPATISPIPSRPSSAPITQAMSGLPKSPPMRPSPLGQSSFHAKSISSVSNESLQAGSSMSELRLALARKTSRGKRKVFGIQDKLRKEQDGLVKRRQGSVLGRGFILKTDHYPTGRALHLDLEITGAPNFRAPDEEGLNVYGVAQPTVPGLKSILTILGCQPYSLTPPPRPGSRRSSANLAIQPSVAASLLERTNSLPSGSKSGAIEEAGEEGRAVWFSTREETLIYVSGRPYVLRDASHPFQTLALSDRAPNLEDIERRLKQDILDESRKYGGMVLFHDETTTGELVETWLSVDEQSIRTPREVYEDVKDEGWRVEYYRIPIAPDTPIEDNYLDAYVSVLKGIDPLTTSLVFNCGMGVVRTTFGMVAAMLVRRKQLLLRGLDDPFASTTGSGFATPIPGGSGQAAQVLEQATHQQTLNKSLLKLTRVLDRNLPSRQPATAIDLLTSHPSLLDQLRKAHMGNYQVVLSLLSSLDHGRTMKRLVDEVIDCCDIVVNLRENVIDHRIKYSVSALNEKGRQDWLEKAIRALEQYFDLIVFAAYVEEEEAGNTGITFSAWLKNRPEIWNQIKIIRHQAGNRLFAFSPANDLSLISRSSDQMDGSGRLRNNKQPDVDYGGGKVLGDEWAEHVVQNRNGIVLRASTLLKSDQWLAETAPSAEGLRGAVGFRQIKGSYIFTTGQPTEDALSTILRLVHERCPNITNVTWICLREEPLVMINGSPYCLRRDSTALRNLRDYSGVSSSRLEVLEARLKSDVISEISEFQGSLLLHSETPDGEVVPVWESVDKSDVESIRELMDDVASKESDVGLEFVRVPVTSESSPDFKDLTELLDLCRRTDLGTTAFVLNDQLGRGRSSTTAVIMLLIQRWMRGVPSEDLSQSTGRLGRALSVGGRRSRPDLRRKSTWVPSSLSWQIINSVLRVIRNGVEVKRIVDEAIDNTAEHFNLREAIQDFRMQAEEASDEETKANNIAWGINHLRKYFHLLVFQAYLDDTDPEDEEPYSFESFVKHRPVFKTLETELEHGGLQGLTPIDRMDPAEGMALPDEVSQVVANRTGNILSAQTILKSDFFSGLQKQSLPERVDGAANYRRLPLILDDMSNSFPGQESNEHFVYGTGMPSGPGLRNALAKMGAEPGGSRHLVWTSLREEPVLYVNSRPHVLRLVDKPLNNVETTGVAAAVVERMELALKQDVLREIRVGGGKILLHDEAETKPGTYEVIPIWETVEEKDVMTPKEMYEAVLKEGYQVDYLRVAITDEQAPLPATLQNIVQRVVKGLEHGADFVMPALIHRFNCQMGRGRTTTGMIAACLIATVSAGYTDYASDEEEENGDHHEGEEKFGNEAEQFLNGEYKTILQLVTVLSHGKEAKRLTDRAINRMEGVQNLRKAVYDFKVRLQSAEPGSAKHKNMMDQTVNYLYRYGALIVLANFLLENKEAGTPFTQMDFPAWMHQHREIRNVLSRRALD